MRWTSRSLFILLLLCAPLPRPAQTGRPEVRVLVNQAGYGLDGAKHVLLQADRDLPDVRSFELVRGERTVYRGVWRSAARIPKWGLCYKEGYLPSLPAGEYRLRTPWQGETFESPPVRVGSFGFVRKTGPLASYFFYAQRCGTEVPGWHGPCHLDDARMPDGTRRDLSGGWHDAGDYNKYNGYTPLAVYALAKFALSPSAQCGEWRSDAPSPLLEAFWGAEWLKKCLDRETRTILGRVFSGFSFWDRPEGETDTIPGNGDDRRADVLVWNENEMAAAAWAALFLATGDPSWRDLALEVWTAIEQNDPGTNAGQRAKRLLAALELFRATGGQRFAEDSRRSAAFLVASQEPDGGWPLWPMAIVEGGIVPAALAEFASVFPASELGPSVRRALSRHLDFWAVHSVSPFAIPKWSEDDIFYPYLPEEWHVGQNSRYLSQAWAGLLIAKVLTGEKRRAGSLAEGCLDWVLGLNPFGVCMMNEAGAVHLDYYHHRYDRIPNGKNGNVPGAICNGIIRQTPVSDVPYLDLEGRSWQTNEPWLPHNAFFLLALAERDAEGGPRREKRGDDIR